MTILVLIMMALTGAVVLRYLVRLVRNDGYGEATDDLLPRSHIQELPEWGRLAEARRLL